MEKLLRKSHRKPIFVRIFVKYADIGHKFAPKWSRFYYWLATNFKVHQATGRKFVHTIKCLLMACIISGCTTVRNYRTQASSFYNDYRLGDLNKASLTVSTLANKKAKSTDALLWRLEEGSLLRTDNKFQESNTAFGLAEEIIGNYDSRAKISARDAGRGIAALVTNLNAIPYKGYAYDRIMLNTYKALNYMALGEFREARVELIRAYERQKEALDRYRRELENAEQKAQSKSIDVDRITNDPRLKQQIEKNYGQYGKMAAYADYVNPLTVYLDGLLFLATGDGGSDYERARKDFERVRGMIGGNSFIEDDLAATNSAIYGQQIEPVVYVIFENGLAPVRNETRLDIPVPAKEIAYVGAAFPILNFQRSVSDSLIISDDQGKTVETTLLSNMDGIIANEFHHQLRTVMIHTIMAAAVKATAQYQLEKNFGSLGKIGGAIYSMVTTQADLRSWISLPKEFQFARIARPDSSFLYLGTPEGTFNTKVELPQSDVILIYAKMIEGSALSYVHTIKLR